MYDIVFLINNLEGYGIKTFDNLSDALHFAENESNSRIYSYKQVVPVDWNTVLCFN